MVKALDFKSQVDTSVGSSPIRVKVSRHLPLLVGFTDFPAWNIGLSSHTSLATMQGHPTSQTVVNLAVGQKLYRAYVNC